MIRTLLFATLLSLGCTTTPDLRWSMDMTVWIEGEPFFFEAYYFNESQCEDAIERVFVGESTRFVVGCRPITEPSGIAAAQFEDFDALLKAQP